ncbi:MAG: regulator of chromosome condensation, partial [Verrucomicrobiales bacterium]|nr:regulator of chromosome condensation [Verrucomicrobiales bacterium]
NTGGRAFKIVAVGGRVICALDAAGQAYCWGDNFFGQLGNGTTTGATTPQATSTSLRFTSIATGYDFACGVTTGSTVACWGLNSQGSIGNGTTTNQLTPLVVSGITGALDVQAGEFHACARTSADFYCWGANFSGQVGDGTFTSPRTTPAKTAVGITPVGIAAFSRSSSCVSTTKQLYCWGSSYSIGDGTGATRTIPTAVQWPESAAGDPAMPVAVTPQSLTAAAGTPQVVTVLVRNAIGTALPGVTVNFVVTSGGGSVTVASVVTDASGRASSAWNLAGSTGTVGTLEARVANIPTLVFTGTVGSVSGSMSITGGNNQFLPDYFGTAGGLQVKVEDGSSNPVAGATVTFTAASGSGTVATAAVNTAADGTASNFTWTTPLVSGTDYTLQASVPGLSPVTFTARRLAYYNNGASNLGSALCRLTTAGAAYCWGGNAQGQVGDGSNTNRTAPTAVAGGLTFTALAKGSQGFHNCALTSGGTAYCWGANEAGQLGNGTQANSNVPVAVSGGLAFSSLSTGALSTCGITTANALYCWGWGGYSFRADSSIYTTRNVPTLVNTGSRTFVSVNVGRTNICALDASGQAFCWGENYGGQLGTGTTTYSVIPVATSTALRFASLTLGVDYSCGLTTASTVACWGWNGNGSVGNGTTTNQLTPATVPGVTGALDARAGEGHSCARTGTAVYCWGSNFGGQVGDGTSTNRPSATVAVTGVTPTDIPSFSRYATCISTASQLYCWGGSQAGIGDGTFSNRSIATVVPWPESSAGAATIVPITPQSITAAAGAAQNVTVQMKSAAGVVQSGVTVNFVVTSGGGSVSVASSVTDASGTASTDWSLAGAVGASGTMDARVSGVPTITFTGTITAGAGSLAIT